MRFALFALGKMIQFKQKSLTIKGGANVMSLNEAREAFQQGRKVS